MADKDNRPAEPQAPPDEALEFGAPRPEQEFTPPGSGGLTPPDPGRRKRRLRRALYAAAAMLLMGAWFGAGAPSPAPAAAETGGPAPVIKPTERPAAAPSAPAPTERPAPSPAPTPSPTPEPTPAQPGAEIVFFDFSAMHYGEIRLISPQLITAARAEIWEAELDTLEWSHELTKEELAAGDYMLPAFDESETYFKHMDAYRADNGFPALELRVALTVSGGEELSYAVRPSYEQGWSVKYWPEDYKPMWDGEEYYPGCFAVMSYEAYGAPPVMGMGGYEDAEKEGGIRVALRLNAQSVPAGDARVVTREESYEGADGGKGSFFYATLVIPRPADAPESGTAVFTVCQRLEGYDLVWTSERELAYGP